MKNCLALLALVVTGVMAFVPTGESGLKPATALKSWNDGRNAVASALATGFLLATFVGTAPVSAAPEFSGSTEIVAARSGGRSGGRASSGRSYAAPMRSSPASFQRTTVIRQPVVPSPSVIVAPGMGYGFGYSPLGGFGLGYGLGAIDGVGNAIRDARQEGEIQRARDELQESKMREAEMEARIRQLEMMQATQQANK